LIYKGIVEPFKKMPLGELRRADQSIVELNNISRHVQMALTSMDEVFGEFTKDEGWFKDSPIEKIQTATKDFAKHFGAIVDFFRKGIVEPLSGIKAEVAAVSETINSLSQFVNIAEKLPGIIDKMPEIAGKVGDVSGMMEAIKSKNIEAKNKVGEASTALSTEDAAKARKKLEIKEANKAIYGMENMNVVSRPDSTESDRYSNFFTGEKVERKVRPTAPRIGESQLAIGERADIEESGSQGEQLSALSGIYGNTAQMVALLSKIQKQLSPSRPVSRGDVNRVSGSFAGKTKPDTRNAMAMSQGSKSYGDVAWQYNVAHVTGNQEGMPV